LRDPRGPCYRGSRQGDQMVTAATSVTRRVKRMSASAKTAAIARMSVAVPMMAISGSCPRQRAATEATNSSRELRSSVFGGASTVWLLLFSARRMGAAALTRRDVLLLIRPLIDIRMF